MPRLHLMELEDQTWFPAQIRDCMTDLLNFIITKAHIYDPIVPILYQALIKANSRSILDLCSGGAGSVRSVQGLLLRKHNYAVDIQLSDLFPNDHAQTRTHNLDDPSIDYLPYSIDATKVPSCLQGFRTLFTSFHHFDPDSAKKILSDAAQQGRGIAIFEFTERKPLAVLAPLLSPLAVWLVTPFLRPFSLMRLVLTYIIPVIPACFLFDGIVSQMRSYTHEEMLDLTKEIKESNYRWEAGTTKHKYLPFTLTYLVGYHAPNSDSA